MLSTTRMIRALWILPMLVVLGVRSVAATYPATLEELLPRVDEAISRSDDYKQRRIASIDSLCMLLANVQAESKAMLCEEIAMQYCELNMDSAVAYFDRGRSIAMERGDSVIVQRLFFEASAVLPVMGVLKESLDNFEAVRPSDVYPENRVYYYSAGNHLFFFMSSFYPLKALRHKYLEKGVRMTDSLVAYIDKGTPEYKLNRAQLSFVRGDTPTMVSDVHDLMGQLPIDDRRFSSAAYMLGLYYDRKGKTDEAVYYLGLASLSDIYSGSANSVALQDLGLNLYERGDIDRAYSCLTLALANANESRSMLRAVAASEALPVIASTFLRQDRSKLRMLTWLLVVIVVALFVIVGFIIWLRLEMTRLERMKHRLAEANSLKEAYIGQFLYLCSIYMEKQEEFHKLVGRKIAAGQVDDLYAMIRSGKMLEDQSHIFYTIFDDVFINMYPTFVDDVNALLMDDRRVQMADGAMLNTEMRILAFMRLGVDDSAKVARFLGLSLNTVYTYRNKLKNRARNRDSFECDVMRIGQILQ